MAFQEEQDKEIQSARREKAQADATWMKKVGASMKFRQILLDFVISCGFILIGWLISSLITCSTYNQLIRDHQYQLAEKTTLANSLSAPFIGYKKKLC